MRGEKFCGRREAGGGKMLSTFHLKPSTQRRSAFTLIELLGVMAIIGVLSAVILPPMIAKIEDAQTTNEDAKLEEIARALVKGIMVSGGIPNPNLTPFSAGGWASIAQPHTSLDGNSLLYVFPPGNAEDAEGEHERRVYLDDTLMRYLASITGSANVPFPTPSTGWPVNTAGGVAFPNQAMPMYIVSASKRGREFDLYCTPNQPGVMMNPAPQDSPAFGAGLIGDLRNWVKTAQTTGPNAGSIMVPQSIARWGANSGTMYRRGEFLHVKVVDLRPLFCRVNLREYPLPQSPTTTSVGSGYTGSTPYNGTSAAGFVFSFTTPTGASGFTTPTSGSFISGKGMIMRTSGVVTDTGTIPISGGSSANFSASVSSAAPYPPWWVITPPGVVIGNQMPTTINTASFYVIKGTSLSLYTDGVALPPNPVLTVQINADTTFEYFNGSWTRVD